MPSMKRENIAIVALAVIIGVCLTAYLVFTYYDEIFTNVFGESDDKIELSAIDDEITVYLEDGQSNLNVLENDLFPGDLDNLTITATEANHGKINDSDNLVLYTPEEGYTGTDQITYTLKYKGKTDSGVVKITVEEKIIEYQDSINLNYIEYIYYNETNKELYKTSYDDIENKSNGAAEPLYIAYNNSDISPYSYYGYTRLFDGAYVEGLVEGLIGMKEGENKTIGPLSVEKAYGIGFGIGQTTNLTKLVYKDYFLTKGFDMEVELTEKTSDNFTLKWVNITENQNISSPVILINDFVNDDEDDNFIILAPYFLWDDNAVITEVKEDTVEVFVTPDNLTNIIDKIESIQYGNVNTIIFPEESTASYNDTYITITNNPELDKTYEYSVDLYGQTLTANLTINEITDDMINITFEYAGQQLYQEVNRSFSFKRNYSIPRYYTLPYSDSETLGITEEFTNKGYNLHPLTDEKILFYVEIDKIYKTSDES